jgi:hypothetical protein
MNKIVPIFVTCVLLGGCARNTPPRHTAIKPPWKDYSERVAALVDQHAPRSAFDNVRESGTPPQRLHDFSAVERIVGNRDFPAAERVQYRRWFRSAASVWHYSFQFQFSGVLFLDASGRVEHALLFG